MDSLHFGVPAGTHTEEFRFKACVLGPWQAEVVWPLLWAFVRDDQHESVVGKQVLATAEEVLGKGFIRHLLIDRGYLDGQWITDLYRDGTRVTLGIKEDMLVMEELHNLSQLKDTVWVQVEPPKLHEEPLPERFITGFTDLQEEWQGCQAPLSGCQIRDIILIE